MQDTCAPPVRAPQGASQDGGPQKSSHRGFVHRASEGALLEHVTAGQAAAQVHAAPDAVWQL